MTADTKTQKHYLDTNDLSEQNTRSSYNTSSK